MHVTPKQIAFAAVAAVLLAVVLFWQGAADGMDQELPETAADGGSAPAVAQKSRDGARYEKIRGMESQVAVEDLRNPFSENSTIRTRIPSWASAKRRPRL